jgi:excisionase family DNA binding protein
MDASETPAELLTVAEVADRLRLTRLSVYRRIEAGVLPALRIGERGPIRVRLEAVEALLVPAGRDGRRGE